MLTRKVFLFLITAVIITAAIASQAGGTEWDRYLSAPRPANMTWAITQSDVTENYTLHTVVMTAQSPSANPATCQLSVLIPATVRTQTALLMLDGGEWTEAAPEQMQDLTLYAGPVSASMGAVMALLNPGHSAPSSWVNSVQTVIAAMDAVTELTQAKSDVKIDQFVIAGDAGQGWTPWLTAAAIPDRIAAAVPMTVQARKSAGALFSESSGIHPEEYANRLSMPVFIMMSAEQEQLAGSEMPFCYEQLSGAKAMRLFPNLPKGVDGVEAMLLPLIRLFNAFINDALLPVYAWGRQFDGDMAVALTEPASSVLLWQPSTMASETGEAWTSTPLHPVMDGAVVYALNPALDSTNNSVGFLEVNTRSGFTFTTGLYAGSGWQGTGGSVSANSLDDAPSSAEALVTGDADNDSLVNGLDDDDDNDGVIDAREIERGTNPFDAKSNPLPFSGVAPWLTLSWILALAGARGIPRENDGESHRDEDERRR